VIKDKNDTITIYWSPSPFTNEDPNWNFLYTDPISSVADLNTIRDKSSKNMFTCPAYTQSMKNVFIFKNVLPDKIQLDEKFFALKEEYPFYHFGRSKVLLNEHRPSSLEQHVNVIYNMGWLFFADQSVEARFTAPYFPPVSPSEGVMLSTGQFNIGEWYRDYYLDYHIPFGTKELNFEENQPLFYLEVRTDKKVVFKRYDLTKQLRKIADECSESSGLYEQNKSLLHRYNMFKKSSSPERVLFYIKQSLVQ
jgi:hypothetical protein